MESARRMTWGRGYGPVDADRMRSALSWPARAVVALLSVLLCHSAAVAKTPLHGVVNDGPYGPSGVQKVEPGNEVQIYSIELGDINGGAPPVVDLGLPGTNPGIQISIGDMSFPTGLKSSDFSELRLYRSGNGVLDAGDAVMASVSPVSVNPASVNQLDVTGLPIGGNRRIPGAGIWFIISAVISPSAQRGHAFRVSAAAENIGIDENGGFPPPLLDGVLPDPGNVLLPGDGSSVIIGDQIRFLPGGGAGGIAIPFGGEGAILLALLASGGWVLYRRRGA